jgi:hypothetical protein
VCYPLVVRIVFRKISDERHVLEIVRDDGRREHVDCETRSYLQHDLLHYAVESEARLEGGFWGCLAKGRTLAEMNDRSGKAMAAAAGPPRAAAPGEPSNDMHTAPTSDMGTIEQVVGAVTGVLKGRTPYEIVTGLGRYAESVGSTLPSWLTARFIVAVQDRMRQLLGQWKATPYGGSMELAWPAPWTSPTRA